MIKINRDKIMLAQFHDAEDDGDGIVKHYVEDPKTGKKFPVTGLKLYSLHDGYSQLITQYDPDEDTIDLTPLKERKDHQVYFVSGVPGYDSMVWKTFKIDDLHDEIFSIKSLRLATSEEVKQLDEEIYPEFFDNCYF